MKVTIDWDVSSYTGWGIFGLYLALEWAKDPAVEATALSHIDPSMIVLDPLRRHTLAPFMARSGARRPPHDAVGLHWLGNEFVPEGDAPIGVIVFERQLSRAALERAKRYQLFITVSPWNEEMLRDQGLSNVRTVLQGVDPTLCHPAPRSGLFPGRFLIFSGGKAEPRKAQDLVVAAFRIFAQRHRDAMLVTAWHSPWPALGKGMDLDLAAVADRVIDVGVVPNPHMPAIYRECDVALFPNRAEGGTNLVAMECLACGVPVILSANTGHLQLTGRDGVYALEKQRPLGNGWGESDLDEILHALELAYERRQPLPCNPIPELTWARTTGELIDVVRDFQSQQPAWPPLHSPPKDERGGQEHALQAVAHERRGEWQAALAQLRLAQAAAPNDPQLRLNLAIGLLRMGDYREGLALYEARIDKSTWLGFATAESRAAARGLLLRPGEAVDGRRVVVLAEQGLGDCIMFARYIPLLAQRGARIVLACNPTLRPFCARIPGIATLLSPPPDQPFAQINLGALSFDAWVPIVSLALWFGTDATSVPAEVPYWRPDEGRVAAWRDLLVQKGRPGAPKIGLVFQANPISANHHERSIQIDHLRPLFALAGVDFVNLQHGQAGRELAAAVPVMLDPLKDEVALDEFAAAIAATDLLISVDTMAAHCAGAMRHPVWIAVPYVPHWTWGLDRATTPWYPSARIIRQAQPEDWPSVTAALCRAIERDAQ